MPGILDQFDGVASKANGSRFLPDSPGHFFALQLASKLHEPQTAAHYADLLEHYSVGQLLTAFRRAKTRGSHHDPSRSFHEELRRLGDREIEDTKGRRLAAIRLDRRAIAVAILSGYHLEYPPLVRQLPSNIDKAQSSAVAFLTQVMEKCPFQTAALESLPGDSRNEIQRKELLNTIEGLLEDHGVGIWQVPRQDILAAFAYPPLQTRGQVHEIIETIWPDIIGNSSAPLVRDALALALFCQTEYLFNY